MTTTRASACGKVILLGEHACVYGVPALAAGIERGARAVAETSTASELVLGGARLRADATAKDDRARAFAALLGVAETPCVRVIAESDLAAGGGLGSSAALGVAIGRAVTELTRGAPDEAEALERANAWEGVFHGNPSGIDTAVAAKGGCVRYDRDTGTTPVAPARDLWLAIGSTGTGASTRAMVDSVARLRARKPEVVAQSFEGIRSLVDNAVLAVQAGDAVGLGRLLDLNQMLLAGLMVSTEALETLCSVARASGALGAKLTGAGGGGSVVALAGSGARASDETHAAEAEEAAERIVAAFRLAGFDGFVARVRASTFLGGGA